VTPVLAHIGLGSNLEDPASQVERTFAELAALPGTRLARRSRLYRTPPWGLPGQPDFINAVAEVDTTLAPRDLLDQLLAIELRRGRRRDGDRWGPRVIDLDVLLYGNLRLREPGIEVPHPRLHERAFVLVPLAELDRTLDVPGQGSVGALADALADASCVPL
jgi:2-amino-4-hydroxy-6-hydroxymethyldihydropteridine diphosphokinase